jgi:hypothetical protein
MHRGSDRSAGIALEAKPGELRGEQIERVDIAEVSMDTKLRAKPMGCGMTLALMVS